MVAKCSIFEPVEHIERIAERCLQVKFLKNTGILFVMLALALGVGDGVAFAADIGPHGDTKREVSLTIKQAHTGMPLRLLRDGSPINTLSLKAGDIIRGGVLAVFNVDDDGSFALKDDRGTPFEIRAISGAGEYTAQARGDDGSSSRFLLTPGSGPGKFQIRETLRGLCLTDATGVDIGAGWVQNLWRPCGWPEIQEWEIVFEQLPLQMKVTPDDIVALAAYTSCVEHRVKFMQCDMVSVSSGEPQLRAPEIVSDVLYNGTGSPLVRKVVWSQTTSQSNSVTDASGQIIGGGLELSPQIQGLGLKFTAKYEYNWSTSTTHTVSLTQSASDELDITIPAGVSGWVVRQAAVIQFRGNWNVLYLSTDKYGEVRNATPVASFSGVHATTLPVERGLSRTVVCDTQSSNQVCLNTRPSSALRRRHLLG